MDLVGHQVGAYRILSLLGRGGTAEVYKAFHPALKREVAVKVLLQEVSRDLDWVRRFKQEAELLGRLDHPHILPVYDFGEHEGRPYLVMKYMLDGTTLRTQLSGQPWPLNRVVKVVSQVADALDAAHQAGVVHRDIKPSNILVTPDLKCLVFDFGIAKPFQRQEATTGSGIVVGTPEFMSPEQCRGEKIDHRSDVYSLGVMTYQMLTGHVPFTAETAVGILMKHLTEPLPIPPRGVALPPAVNGVLRRAMSRDPQERYGTAGEFSDAFKQSADQRATVTLHAAEIRRAATPTLKLPLWARPMRSRGLRMTVAGGLLTAMLVFAHETWPPSPTALPSPPEPPQTEFSVVIPALDEVNVRAASEKVSAEPNAQPPAPAEPPPPPMTSPSAKLARLEIETNEPADVFLDGHPIGTAPDTIDSVEPGDYVLTLDAGHGRVHERNITVTAGSTHHLRFDFSETPMDVTAVAELLQQGAELPEARVESPKIFEEPPRIREWTGYLTDENCGETGGKQGALHLRCAERCIREGKQPMLFSRGKLYRLDGYDRLERVHGEPLRFKGWLELDTIHVTDPDS